MSKAAKQSILILIVLLVASLGFAGYTILEKQKLEKERLSLQDQLKQSSDRENKYLSDNKSLQDEKIKIEEDLSKLALKVKKAEKQSEDLQGEVAQVTSDRDQWKSKVDAITKERDDLIVQFDEMKAKYDSQLEEMKKSDNSSKSKMGSMPDKPNDSMFVGGDEEKESDEYGEYKDEEKNSVEDEFNDVENRDDANNASASYAPPAMDVIPEGSEGQWAVLLKEKASLEIQVENLKTELNKNSIEIVELKRKSDSFQIEIDSLKHEKEELEREVKFKEDLSNNLSLELARAKNDKKYNEDHVERLNKDNQELRGQLKQLVASKSAVEKTIVRLTEDKSQMEKRLRDTESVVQSKIDEIWNVKESLDKSLKSSQVTSSEIELPPIVVNSNAPNPSYLNSGAPGFDGKVISINDDNNFIIVNLGEGSGVRLGDTLSIYRDSKYIARVEVIQVRNDISAADIKDQWSKIKIGDSVK